MSETSRSAAARATCRDTPATADYFNVLRLVQGTQPRSIQIGTVPNVSPSGHCVGDQPQRRRPRDLQGHAGDRGLFQRAAAGAGHTAALHLN